MCYIVVQHLFDMRNLFTLFCTTLTLLLIYQELVAFTMTRPTSNYRKEKELKTADIPEIVLCFEPGFDFKVLEKYGYNTATYCRGSMDLESFVGWNSNEKETRSSKEILEDVLLVDSQLLHAKSLLSANYSDDHVDFVPAEMKLRTIAYPFGRCIWSSDKLFGKRAYFSNPPKKLCNDFFGGAQDLILVQLILIMQKIIKKPLSGYFVAYPPKPHYSAPQCSAMYCSVNTSIIQSRWIKYDPWCPKMTDYGPGWHTRGQGGTRGSKGAPGGARGVQATPGAKMSDKTVK